MRPTPKTKHWKDGKCRVCGYKGLVTDHGKRCHDCFMVKLYRCFFCGWEMEKDDAVPMVSGQPTAGYLCPDCDRQWPNPFRVHNNRQPETEGATKKKTRRQAAKDFQLWIDVAPCCNPQIKKRQAWKFIRQFYLRRKRARELAK